MARTPGASARGDLTIVEWRWPLGICLLAFLVYGALGAIGHNSLRTNAFDLSVFDYALWSTGSGGPLAYVPMFRHSLFAQHFMPTLLLLAPLARMFDSPAYLIVLQTLFYAAAGFVFFLFAARHVNRTLALALLAAFLFSRRSHAAVTSYFYIESAEPLLVFSALLAWSTGRRALFWVLAVLAMGCKEDMPLYFLAFGVKLAVDAPTRRQGLTLVCVSTAWLLTAVFVAVPYFREFSGLDAANPFLAGRYALEGGIQPLVLRLFSLDSLGAIVTMAGATAYLCFLSPWWLAVALPGLALNLMALPDTGQAGLNAHYLWPLLPWLFIAAVFGAQRLSSARARWLPLLVLLVVLIDLPVAVSIARMPWRGLPQAAEVRGQLRALSLTGTLVAQPNLIPHLPHRRDVHGLGVYHEGQPAATYVLLTRVGNLWPFDAKRIDALIKTYQSDEAWEEVAHGPLFAFRRRQQLTSSAASGTQAGQ